jgi:hypothetical protein
MRIAFLSLKRGGNATYCRAHRNGWHGETNQPVFINITNIIINEVQRVGGSIPPYEATKRNHKPIEFLRKRGKAHGKNCH